MRLPAIMWSSRSPLIIGFVVAALAGVVLWFGFHQAAGAVMATVSGALLTMQYRSWLPSRWWYVAAGGLFVGGIVLSRIAAPDWFLLVAVACAGGTAVFALRVLYDPQATDDSYSVDDGPGDGEVS